MKIKITFKMDNEKIIYDNRYIISSWLYGNIFRSDPEFAEKFHSDGMIKLFTFSNIFFKKAQFFEEHMKVQDKKVNIYLSSMNKDFSSAQIKGLFDSVLHLGDNILKPIAIRTVKTRKIKHGEDEIKTLSPVSISKSNYKGVPIYWARPDEELFYELLKNNLLKKYKMVFDREYLGTLIIKPDERFVVHPKLYSVKAGKIKSFEMRLKVNCSKNMKEVMINCGLGEKNSLGFGMVDVVYSDKGGFYEAR